MKKLTLAALIMSFVVNPFSLARAYDSGAPKTFQVTPSTLRERLLSNNLSITQAMNQVHDAKDKVNVARASILPSVNLGFLASLATGPTFVLSSVQFLFSFLMPSKWFDLDAQENLFEAQKVSYRLMELNTYSSALSLYYTVLSDLRIQAIYEQEYQDLKKIYDLLKDENDFFGGYAIPTERLQQALAQAQMAKVRASQMKELGFQEVASFRKILALPLDTQITFATSMSPSSGLESGSVQKAVEQALCVAPENEQIDYLIEAAKDQTWSTAFGFISGSSVSAQSQTNRSDGTPQGVAWGHYNANENLNLGFGIFPAVDLSARNIGEIQLQKEALRQEATRLLEASLNSLKEASEQLRLSTLAEAEMQDVYNTKLDKFNQGLATYLDVLLARTQMSEASIARVKAQMDMSQLRVTLHRAALDDEFGKIRGCVLEAHPAQPEGGLGGWLHSVFGGEQSPHLSLDEVCREGGANLPTP